MDVRHVISVRPDATGTWYVHVGDAAEPISAHDSETDAERAALAQTAGDEDVHVIVIDRYMRPRDIRAPRRCRD